MRTLTSYDVDTDALADVFERMADGLRSHDVLVDELIARESVTAEDMADFRFEMAYHATHGFVDVTDPIEYDATHYLRFADRYVNDVLAGRKTATIRVGFERDFDVGDVVDLIDEDGDKFAEATVDAVVEGSVEHVVKMAPGKWGPPHEDEGDLPNDTVGFVTERLRRHYSDSVDAETTVTAIALRDVHDPDTNDKGAGE